MKLWYKNKTLHYSQKIKRNCVRILQRNNKVTTYKWLNTVK